MDNKKSFKFLKLFQMKEGYDKKLHFIVVTLSLFGAFMIVSVISGSTADINYIAITASKLVVFWIIGYFLMVLSSNLFSMNLFKKVSKLTYWVLIGLLLSCLAFSIEDRGASARIRIGSIISIQPSEFVKIFCILFVANYFSNRRYLSKINKLWPVIKQPLFYFILIFVIVVIVQRDLGTGLIIAFVSGICYLIPSHKLLKKSQTILGIIMILAITAFIFSTSPIGLKIIQSLPIPSFQKSRFLVVADPFKYMYGDSYQLVNGLIAFSKGNLFGVGFGNSMLKFGYIAAAHTDFILAIIVEEIGYIGFIGVLFAYGIMMWYLISYGVKIQEEYCKVILFGTASLFFIHFFLNVGGITAFIPLTGVPLLFVSNGGSALWMSFILIGICQNIIARHNLGEIV